METLGAYPETEGICIKILILSDFAHPMVGGTERHVFGLSKYLVENGNEVHILTSCWGGNESGNFGGVNIHRVSFPSWENGILRLLYYLFKGLKLDHQEKFDIIHGFYTVPPVIAAALIGRIKRKKTILTFFEPEPLDTHFHSALKKRFILQILSGADAITALNIDLETKIRTFLPEQEITTVPNWVEEHFKQKKIEKPGEKIILFVGRLCEQKGADVLIRALPHIKSNFKSVFVGPPWKQKEFEKLAKDLQVADKVEFKGFVDESKLVDWYNKASILVYPTIEKGGFGFTIIEAMACGTPVVGSDDMGVPYAVGNAGIITKRGDEKELAAGISKLLDDEKLYMKLSENAIKRANETFRRDMVLKKYSKVYGKLRGERDD